MLEGGQAKSRGGGLPTLVTFTHLICSPPGWTESPLVILWAMPLSDPKSVIPHCGIHTAAEHSRPGTSPEISQRPDVFEDFKQKETGVLEGQSGLSWRTAW